MTDRRSMLPQWLVLAGCLALFATLHRAVALADPGTPANGATAGPNAGPDAAADPAAGDSPEPKIDFRELIGSAGWIGLVILLLSVAMLALIVEHLLSLRGAALLPPGLLEDVHQRLTAGRAAEARQLTRENGSFLARILDAGLAEVDLGHAAVEKAVEDTAVAQTSRLYRKIEYLSIIGTIAPMLGLLGTVWGMIGAFLAFESKANPQVAELAPGITRALVTTLLGLGVAVPALAGYGLFRNRIEGLTDEGTQLAEHVFSDLKRAENRKRSAKRAADRPARRNPDAEARS